jgi:hypothetical protein
MMCGGGVAEQVLNRRQKRLELSRLNLRRFLFDRRA